MMSRTALWGSWHEGDFLASGRNIWNFYMLHYEDWKCNLKMFSRQGQRKKSVKAEAGQSSVSERPLVPCGVTVEKQPFPKCWEAGPALSKGQAGLCSPERTAVAGSVARHCHFALETGETKTEPVLDPAVFFHLHQENFAVSAGGGAKHPLASPNASACQICCVGFTTNHVSFWLPQHCTSLCQDQLAGDCGTNSSSLSVVK